MKYLNKSWIYLVLILFSFTPLVWFLGKGNVIINGVDTNFPLDPVSWFLRRLFVWNSVLNGGIDFSSSTSGLFFHLIQVVPFILGLNLQLVQILSLVFWFSLIIYSSFTLSRVILPKYNLAQLLFVVLYSFNIYLFNTWENVKVANLSLLSAIPFALTLLIQLKRQKLNYFQAAFPAILVGIILSGAGINPAYFITFFLILIFYFLGEVLANFKIKLILERLKDLTFLVSLIILVNFFWILPTADFISKNITTQGSIDKIGFTNWIDSLSENTSILNITRMQGAWDWYVFDSASGLPQYIPYATNYFFNPIFIIFSFLLPALVLGSFILRKKEQSSLYIGFGAMMITGIFLGVGTHMPTGLVFSWLYYSVPFLTLFRSPWYIFTPLLVIAFSALVSLLFYNLRERLKILGSNLANTVVFFAVVTLIVGNLFYSYPIIQSNIFRPSKQDSFFVHFPEHVFQAQKWLKAQNKGRIISYPDDEIERFNWGYIGIESIVGLLSNQETLFSPLNLPNSPVAGLIQEFYKRIKRKELNSANSLASKLNIGTIFVKGDQASLSPSLENSLKNFTNISFGPWKFYQITNEDFLPKIYSTSDISLIYPYNKSASISSVLPAKTLLINPKDKVVVGATKTILSSGKGIVASNSHNEVFNNFQNLESVLSQRLISRDLSKVIFDFEIPEKNTYQPVIEKYRLEDFGIDLSKGFITQLDGKQVTLSINKTTQSFVYFNALDLDKGEHQLVLKLINRNLVSGGNVDSEFVFERKERGKGESKYEIASEDSKKILGISNFGKAETAADFKVSSFDPFSKYYVEVKYRQIYGNNALTLVVQYKDSTLFKAQTERMPNHPEWKQFSFFYDPVDAPSDLKVALNAPFTADPLGTKVLYNDLKVFELFTNNLFFLSDSTQNFLESPNVEFKKDSPAKYEAEVEAKGSPHIIVFSENYSTEWEIALFDKKGSRIKVNPPHFSANAYANAWYIEGVNNPYKLEIFYKPQRLYWIGSVISILTIILVTFLFIRVKIINLRRRSSSPQK